MRAIVTGASGLLGRHLVDLLLAKGWQVTAVIRPTSIRLRTDVDYRLCDLSFAPLPATLFRECDAVFHTAAAVTDWAPWSFFVANTIAATARLCDSMQAGGCRRLIHASTVGVYGRPRTSEFLCEEQPFASMGRWDYYTNSKIAAEQVVWERQRGGLLDVTVLRPAMIYGPSRSGLVARVAALGRTGKLALAGNPQTHLPLVHVADVARAAVLAAESPVAINQALNIVSDEPISQAEFFNTIAALAGGAPVTRHIPYRLAYSLGFIAEIWAHLRRAKEAPRLTRYRVSLFGHPRVYSTEKLRSLLHWQPTIVFSTGIQQTMQWINEDAKPQQ